MRNLSLAMLLGAMTSLPLGSVHASPTLPEWVDEATPLGLKGFNSSSHIAPVWMDADLDGELEVVYVSFGEVRVLDIAADGAHASTTMEILSGPPLQGLGMQAFPALSLLDVDGDGINELMVLGATIRIFRVSAPYQLKDLRAPLPLPGAAAIFDAATGDLNNDGLNDVVFAQGIVANEKLERIGYPDSVLMNLGHGRFEMMWIEPSRSDFSNGITLVDIDGDRRLDIVESIKFSRIVGPSRILLNRTPPGAPKPVFVPHISSLTVGGQGTNIVPGHDTGTHGMGACIADINGDGYLDIYNTSTGVDQLSLGRADGGFDDATFTHGILHSYGANGLRIQWSPTFVDINLDGLLDIYVRHGGLGMSIGDMMGPAITTVASDPVYVQDEGGMFVRAGMYAEPNYNTGRNAVFGDLDRDGRPDVALGGGSGSSGYYRNVTPVPNTTRTLTVGFQSSVSASPAYGVRVIATCGEQTLTRRTTSGGKMGSIEAHEVYFAWPECATDPDVVVQWPSGATVSVSDVAGPYHLAVEPQWWVVPDPAVHEVTVYPASAGATAACVGTLDDDPETWACCSATEGSCSLEVPDLDEQRPLVRLDDHLPMALPWQTDRWVLVTEPQPPRPGEPVSLHVMHVGSPGAFEAMEKPTIFVDNEYITWTYVNEKRQLLTAEIDVPEGAHELELSLYPVTYPQPTFVVGTGYAMDPILSRVDAYPYRILGGVTELWTLTIYVTAIRGRYSGEILPHIKLYRPDGVEIPSNGNMDGLSTARVRLIAGIDDLEGLDQVILKDGPSGVEIPIGLPPLLTMEEAAEIIDHAEGGAMWNRLAEGGDLTGVFFGLYDAQGRLLPPEPELVYLEIEEAEMTIPLEIAFGRYQLWTLIETLPGVTEGKINVYAINDGRSLASFPFLRRATGGWGVRMDKSSAKLKTIDDLWGSGVTHDVIVRVVNGFDEVLGANAPVEVEVVQFGKLLGMHLAGNGSWVASLQANTGKGVLEADVWIEGSYFDTVSIETNIPIPPQPPGETGPGEEAPVSQEPSLEDDTPEEPVPVESGPGRDGGGCGGGGGIGGGVVWLLLPVLMGWLSRRRIRVL